MKKSALLSIIFLFVVTLLSAQKGVKLKSPSNKLTAKFKVEKTGLNLLILNGGKTVLNANPGRFVFDKDSLPGRYSIKKIRKTSVRKTWEPVYGERNLIADHYNEMEITLRDKNASGNSLTIICRAYDEGIAFRYRFDSLSTRDLILKKELTNFAFDGDYEAWVTNTAQGAYKKLRLSDIDVLCERPLVIEQNERSYLALGEAALVDFARMKFKRDPENPLNLHVTLDGEVNLKKAGYITPWRYVMVADSPAKLLENNTFILNLNEPCQIQDFSWIKPGKVIREVTLTTQGGMACVDFAVRNKLQYVEFDAGWYGNENDDLSDATTVTVDPNRSTGPLDLHAVIKYAESKGIGIILYVNRRALEKQLDTILPLYKSWGIKGLKYGFVKVGSQEWTSWLHEAVRKASDYQMMVDIHDEYRPTGYSRTYPNLMTQEGIRGDEESPPVEQTLITLFTRMIAGAGDNTNCYYAERVPLKMGGKAAQMAKAVVLYSPWQFLFWYDRPSGSPGKTGGAGANQAFITEGDDLSFYHALPTVWDDTKVLEGEIGSYATVARKSGNNWFIGSLAADQPRKVEIPLSFLDDSVNYEAVVYYQDEKDLKNNEVKMERMPVNKKTVLTKELLQNSGMAVIIYSL